MTERHHSKDGRRDSDRFANETPAPSGQGREGGRPARNVATRDERKRATERPAGATRVRKSDEREDD